ncbi:beta-galactosidase [Pyrinomonas methylaliphatogenes]|uniref:beta-galactosidase n=1 Tax=Pyrinomonas methylaliphatogenes TaxID=454194 RepID=A0A0B6WTT1_9BACT|nr:beta-galactosidase [Pyrinomonas methylaliphatogenes]CDM64456.1 beta-galactosidase [Pyrinomonas methylaliphatogenes]
MRLWRRTALSLLIARLLLLTVSAQEESFFPVAVWYGGGRARAPMLEARVDRDRWRQDLKQIKSLGFNAIRCWVDWATAEPVEGKYDFAALDALLDLAEELDLKVIVQVYVDSAPDWVGKKYREAEFVSISGDRIRSESAPGYCFDHPGVRRAVLDFYAALATHLKGKRAFYGWDLWSEPHVINWAQATYLVGPEFCFCPYSVARYREWLKKKYGSLDALNHAWYRRFADWSEVEPNRLSTILSYTDYIDWRFFIIDKLAEDLRARREAVKRILPDRVATSHAAAPSLFTSPLSGDGSPDDWLMAEQVDFWGTSFYPKHSFPVGRDVAWRGALLDFARSASGERGFWVGELQGGFGTVALRISSTVTPEDIRIWTWSAVARGAKAINFYAWYPMSSGYESGGFGLINLDGTVTERAREAGRIAQTIDRHRALFLRAHPARAEIAIVYNPLSYMVGGRRPLQAAGPQGEFVNIERNSMLGIYRALFPANVPVDFLHVDRIARGEARRYKLIFLPYPLMLSEAASRALIEYVKQGGALVAEARLAWNDERGRAKEIIPGFGLHEVCGCRETAVQQTASGKTEIEVAAAGASLPLLKPGDRLRGLGYEETLTPISPNARVVARFSDGSPAIVASTFGRGKMIAIGTFLGAAYEAERDPNLARFFLGLLDWAGIAREAEVVSANGASSVEIKLMSVDADQKILFVFNHGEAPVEATVSVKGSFQRAIELTTGKDLELREGEGAVGLTKGLAPKEVWIVHLRP